VRHKGHGLGKNFPRLKQRPHGRQIGQDGTQTVHIDLHKNGVFPLFDHFGLGCFLDTVIENPLFQIDDTHFCDASYIQYAMSHLFSKVFGMMHNEGRHWGCVKHSEKKKMFSKYRKMFTRFHDDEARIQQQMRAQTFAGRYAITMPGPGVNLPFQEDPQLRLQKWGANLHTETVNVESDLIGLTRSLTRDALTFTSVQSQLPVYSVAAPRVEESRASVPAWQFKELEQPRWETPWTNPQAHLEKSFPDNLPTRLLEKDYFRPELSTQIPCDPRAPASSETIDYYLTGRSLCLG